jgi:SecD/SecF fusion protein
MLRAFLPLLTLAALVLAACGNDVRSARCSEPLGGSTVERVYRVDGRDARITASRLCSRLRALGSSQFEAGAVGSDRIRIVARDSEETQNALVAAIEGTSFAVYDWEPNVLGRRGPATPFAGGTALFDAVELAAKAKSRSARYYLFSPDKRPLGQPTRNRDELLAPYKSRGGPPPGSRVVGIPARIAVIEDQRVPGQPSQLHRYFVIENDPELSPSDIRNPRAGADQVTGDAVVSFDFTASGRRAFKRLTERVARRAAKSGASEASFQHFAIVLDGRIVSLPAVDAVANPNGIDAPGAQISGVGSREAARLLARRLGAAPLEGKLELVSVR